MYDQVVKCQRAGLCLSEHFLIKSGKEPIQYIHVDKNRREKRKNEQTTQKINTQDTSLIKCYQLSSFTVR